MKKSIRKHKRKTLIPKGVVHPPCIGGVRHFHRIKPGETCLVPMSINNRNFQMPTIDGQHVDMFSIRQIKGDNFELKLEPLDIEPDSNGDKVYYCTVMINAGNGYPPALMNFGFTVEAEEVENEGS